MRRVIIYIVPALLLSGIGFLFFPAAGRDDAHITYWAAKSLSTFGEILNYNGERVEQSSSLLQVLILAALYKITQLDLVSIGRLTGVAFGIASLFMTVQLTKRIDRRAMWIASLLTATTTIFIYWSFGGLETSLTAFTLCWFLIAFGDFLGRRDLPVRALAIPTLAAISYILVRPESWLVMIGTLVISMLVILIKVRFFERDSLLSLPWKRFLILIVIVMTIAVLVAGFRYLYFESVFPQPVIAKSRGLSFSAFREGLNYLWLILSDWPHLLLTALAGMGFGITIFKYFRSTQQNYQLTLTASVVIVYIFFIAVTGGDWMEGGRFIVPILPVAVIFSSLAITQLWHYQRAVGVILLVLLIFQAIDLFRFTQHFSIGIPLWTRVPDLVAEQAETYSWFEVRSRVNLRDIPLVAELEKTIERVGLCKGSKPIIASDQMGMVPYHIAGNYMGKVEFMDMRGLVERRFTNCPITANYYKGPYGLLLVNRFISDHSEGLLKQCGISMPDIIYNLSGFDSENARIPNYQVVYSQSGELYGDQVLLNQFPFEADEYIAVRSDLICAAFTEAPVKVDFNKLAP